MCDTHATAPFVWIAHDEQHRRDRQDRLCYCYLADRFGVKQVVCGFAREGDGELMGHA